MTDIERKILEKRYLASYDKHEGIFMIVFVFIAIGLIILGLLLIP